MTILLGNKHVTTRVDSDAGGEIERSTHALRRARERGHHTLRCYLSNKSIGLVRNNYVVIGIDSHS